MATLIIRNVNKKIIREFKAKAIKEGFSMGEAITVAMIQWENKHKKKRSLLDLEPIDMGDPHLSEKIDDVLYGG